MQHAASGGGSGGNSAAADVAVGTLGEELHRRENVSKLPVQSITTTCTHGYLCESVLHLVRKVP